MDIKDFSQILDSAFYENGLSYLLTEKSREQLFSLACLLISENKKYNLTSIDSYDGVIYKHFADSLLISELIPSGFSVIDIGCGAGFPSLPLAIARPDLNITSLDSNTKKTGFIDICINKLSLNNIHAVNSRAEDAAFSTLRDSFDTAVARAVSSFPVLSELCIPFVRPGGKFLAMKGPEAFNEIGNFKNYLTSLNSGNTEIRTYELRIKTHHEARTLISTEKLGKTPDNFPRKYSQIIKKPLS
jgi:16S rRNA (guanine527-N7)-methyltransferase